MSTIVPVEMVYESRVSGNMVDRGNNTNRTIFTYRQLVTGTYTEFHLFGTGPITGKWYFNLKINGIRQWLNLARPFLTEGQLDTSKLLLTIPVILGDLMELVIDQSGGGQFNEFFTYISHTEV